MPLISVTPEEKTILGPFLDFADEDPSGKALARFMHHCGMTVGDLLRAASWPEAAARDLAKWPPIAARLECLRRQRDEQEGSNV